MVSDQSQKNGPLKITILFRVFFVIACLSISISSKSQSKESDKEILLPSQGRASEYQFGFTEERGQYKGFKDLLFHYKSNDVFVYFLPDRLIFITTEVSHSENRESAEAKLKGDDNLSFKLSAETTARRFDMVFEGMASNVSVRGEGRQPVKNDFYLAHCPEGILNVPSYSNVRYNNIYPDIDMVFSCDSNGIKYAFEVRPGGNPDLIKIKWDGVKDVHLTANNEIQFSSGSFTFIDKAPVSYCNGSVVNTQFALDSNVVGFNLNEFDNSQTLMIDPALTWASSLLYNGYGTWGGLVTNTAGDFYSVDWEWDPGLADVTTYLASAGSSNLYGGGTTDNDIIISKFSKNGALLWACRYGGSSDDDIAGAVTLDDNNNLYIAGKTFSSNLPLQVLAGAYNQAYNGTCTGTRGYILKFLQNNTRQWATYIDNGANFEPFDIACGRNNDIYICGKSGSSLSCTGISIPFGSGYLGNYTSATASHNFVLRFNSSGALTWSTWLPGGTAPDYYTGRASDIAVDKSTGDVYIAGDEIWGANYTFSAAIISAALTYMGQSDLFYLKFTSANNAVPAYGKYLGGAGFDKINIGAANGDIELDASGNLYMCGHTYSANFPLVNPGTCAYYDGVINDGSGIVGNVAPTQDGYLIKVNSAGNRTLATFFGGTAYTSMKQLKKDSYNNLWICGHQYAAGLPQITHTDYYNQAIVGANNNIMFSQLGPNDDMQWMSYYGFAAGHSEYNGFDIWEPPSTDSLYLYLSGDFNVISNTGGGYQYTAAGYCSGAAEFRHRLSSFAPFTISGTTSLCSGATTTWTATSGGGTWTSSNGAVFTVNAGSGFVTAVASGTATITYSLTISTCVYTQSATISVSASAVPTFTALGPYCIGATPGSLPATSNNGIAGTWSPAAISTSASGTTVYTFTPSVPCAASTTMSVTVNPYLTATISAGGPTTFCYGGSVVLTASGGTTYTWSNGATTASITASVPGVYTANASNGCGSAPSNAITVTVNVPPVAVITGTSTICVGNSSTLSAASSVAGSGTITGYQWWYDNGTTNTAISGATGVTYNATAPGSYSVVITDSNGCSSVSCP